MSNALQDDARERLIDELAGSLTPVTPLPSPLWRTATWLAIVVAFGAGAAMFADVHALQRRLMAEPDMWLAVAGSVLTASLAVFAAFQLSLPDRSARWALLPLPAAALWIVASGAGCLRPFHIQDARDPTMGDTRDCLMIIIGLSIPLSLLLLMMLRRGYSLRPDLTAIIAGLAVAAAAATLLMFFHPFDATLSDLVVHGVGVAIVVAAIRWLGGRALDHENVSHRA
jgi:hypothetical protein